MTLKIDKYQKKLENHLSKFSGKFMNNTKWTKLFRKLTENSDQINKCLIKLIWDDNLQEITIPEIINFSETFSETGINDVLIGGPLSFKEIEFIVFPRKWTINRQMRTQKLEPHKFEQDIFNIKKLIDQIGEFETDFENEKLIIYAYK